MYKVHTMYVGYSSSKLVFVTTQFICHDISLFPEEETEEDCCDATDQDGCFAIQAKPRPTN